MDVKSRLVIGCFLFSLYACQVKSEKIEYGKEQCSFCTMLIVDKTHSAQYVTAKGKQYKFDAIECMLNKLAKSQFDLPILLVADYKRPGTMLDARTAFYLISDQIRSPMGESLSAFSSLDEATLQVEQHGGKTYTWAEIKQRPLNK